MNKLSPEFYNNINTEFSANNIKQDENKNNFVEAENNVIADEEERLTETELWQLYRSRYSMYNFTEDEFRKMSWEEKEDRILDAWRNHILNSD